jgi:uncharacterized protein (TIGR03437 family)
VAAFDFLGNTGPFSDPISASVPGAASARPSFASADEAAGVAPGALITLTGSGLSDITYSADGPPYPTTLGPTQVLVNGTLSPIVAAASGQVTFIAPWEIAGDRARVTVVNGGVRSADQLVRVHGSIPTFPVSAESGQIFAFHSDGSAISSASPAQVGESVTILVRGLGRVEPPPVDGQLPTRSSVPTGSVAVSVAGKVCAGVTPKLAPDYVGLYRVSFSIPAGTPAGEQTVQVSVAGSPGIATGSLAISGQ